MFIRITALGLLLMSNSVFADNGLNCLAKNIYYEARSESREGKIAVAHVTLNRVKAKKFAPTICGVVYQKKQFSWTHSKKLSKIDSDLWNEAMRIAKAVINKQEPDITGNATYFHATRVKPRWIGLVKTKKIGRHIFYRIASN